MKVVTIAMRKGGNGKSTSCQNLASAFSMLGKRVLVIDLDEQGNTSVVMGVGKESRSINNFLTDLDVEDYKKDNLHTWEGVKVLGTTGALSGVEKEIEKEVGSHNILKEKLKVLKEEYDYCFIDTSPSLNTLTLNALCASDYVFIPVSSKYFSLHGLNQTLSMIEKVQMRLNYDLDLLGIAFVIHDGRSSLSKEIIEKVNRNYAESGFSEIICQNINIEKAQVEGKSIFSYEKTEGDRLKEIPYMRLAKSMLLRMESNGKETT